MEFANYQSVPETISSKYVDYLFNKYNIDKKDGKELKEKIIETCKSLEINIEKELNLQLVVIYDRGRTTKIHLNRTLKDVKNTKDAISYFSKIVLENENKEISKFELFAMKEDIEFLKNEMKNLTYIKELYT